MEKSAIFAGFLPLRSEVTVENNDIPHGQQGIQAKYCCNHDGRAVQHRKGIGKELRSKVLSFQELKFDPLGTALNTMEKK